MTRCKPWEGGNDKSVVAMTGCKPQQAGNHMSGNHRKVETAHANHRSGNCRRVETKYHYLP